MFLTTRNIAFIFGTVSAKKHSNLPIKRDIDKDILKSNCFLYYGIKYILIINTLLMIFAEEALKTARAICLAGKTIDCPSVK